LTSATLLETSRQLRLTSCCCRCCNPIQARLPQLLLLSPLVLLLLLLLLHKAMAGKSR
jgi:hypothetical protein